MSEVDEILNNLPRDEQSRRRVWEWIQSQVDDWSERESESQTGESRKNPPRPDRTGQDESQSQAHGDSNEQNSGSNGENFLPAQGETPWVDSRSRRTPRRGLGVSDGSSAAHGGPKHKGKSPFGKPRHSKGVLCSLATT